MSGDVSFIPGLDAGIGSDTPSGVGVMQAGDGVNAPVSVSTGAIAQTSQTVISGTERTTPKGPPVFRWNKYDFLYNAYFGLGGFYDGTALYKSQVEVDDQYLERRATTSYRNFLRQIIDATYLPVFSSSATRKTEVNGVLDEDGKLAPLWNAFLDNVDNRHNSMHKFTKKAVRHARMLGVSFVVVDNFRLTDTMSTAQALQTRSYPYVYMRLPQQVETSATSVDEFNRLTQICFRENPETVQNAKTGQMMNEARWKLWTSMYSVKLRKTEKGEMEEVPGSRVDHNLGEVPVIPVMSSEVEDGTVLPQPDFYGIARTNLDIYNIDSAQMRSIRSCMFPILCLPMTRDNDPSNKQAVSPLQGFYLPPSNAEASYPMPMYLAPPTNAFEAVAKVTTDLIDYLYKQAGQLGVTGVQKASSGIAKAFDFQAMEYVLLETAKMGKFLEEEIARLFQKYVLSEKFDYTVFYEDAYSPTSDGDSVDLYTKYIGLNPGAKAKALALEQLTRMMFSDLDDEEVQPVIDEIRANSEKPEPVPAIPEPNGPVLQSSNTPPADPVVNEPIKAPKKQIKKRGVKNETN